MQINELVEYFLKLEEINKYEVGIMQIKKKIIDDLMANLKATNHILVQDMQYLGRNRDNNIHLAGGWGGDYCRTSSLELISYEIYLREVVGNVAELGVYNGDFAKYINSFFQDRKLYLFDTFEGFDNKDTEKDVKYGYSSGKQDFSETSAELVLNKMPFKDNIIIKKGWFPESAKDINDIFCFVNIDADLYEPIYNGLNFFYPRLSKGGYIFVHDFNNAAYKGAREAVIKFCDETGIPYFPLTDSWGSVVLMK